MVAEEVNLGVIESYHVYKIVQKHWNASYLVRVAASACQFLTIFLNFTELQTFIYFVSHR